MRSATRGSPCVRQSVSFVNCRSFQSRFDCAQMSNPLCAHSTTVQNHPLNCILPRIHCRGPSLSSIIDGTAAALAPPAPAQLAPAQPAGYGIWASVTEGRTARKRGTELDDRISKRCEESDEVRRRSATLLPFDNTTVTENTCVSGNSYNHGHYMLL